MSEELAPEKRAPEEQALEEPAHAGGERTRAASHKRTILSVLVVAVLTPLTLWVSSSMGNVSYYVPSVLIIIYTMIPFFVSFESSRPGARELVMLAVMGALAVASRVAFFFLPNFKPIAGIIAISGIALGARSGFLVGALSLFASNIIFGQGPWTPWQMLAYGLVGFVAGLLADHGIIPRANLKRNQLIALGCGAFAFMVLVAGPILDTSTVFTMLSTVTLEGAIPIYLAGLPVNVSQGVATFLTILLVCNPLLAMIARVKKKYGMGEGMAPDPSRARKAGIAAVAVAGLLASALIGGYIATTFLPGAQEPAAPTAEVVRVSVSVNSDEADGQVSASRTVELPGGSTAYDALVATDLPVESKEMGGGLYVVGIDGLKEKEYGGGSGWTYRVNGEMPLVTATELVLSDGDTVEWKYVTNSM